MFKYFLTMFSLGAPLRTRRKCIFFFASFDDAKILSNLGVALKFQRMFIIVPFIRFLFTAEPLPLT